jgi:hypothetical protein
LNTPPEVAAAPPDRFAQFLIKPIRELDAHNAYIATLARDTVAGYQDFLVALPDDRLATRVRAPCRSAGGRNSWRQTILVATPNAFWSYLRRYPRGPHAGEARRELAHLAAAGTLW